MTDSARAAPLPGPIGRALEPLYRRALARRQAAFDRGEGVHDLGVPVISVGNLSVGGTGKTPTVMRIVGWLIESGHQPVIAMRGYRAGKGRKSDEEEEYRDRFPSVRVVAQPDRRAGLEPVLAAGIADVVVLDDGFQHRSIGRDLDIVLIDALRGLEGGRCLPAGWLREPPEALQRADAVVLMRCDQTAVGGLDELRRTIARIVGRPVDAETRHGWDALRAGEGAEEPVGFLSGRSVVVACAIGNPDAFERSAADAGGKVAARLVRRDHHHWSGRDLAALRRLLDEAGPSAMVLTTEKDWVKWRRLDLGPDAHRFVRPRVEIRFMDGEELLKRMVLASAGGSEVPGRL